MYSLYVTTLIEGCILRTPIKRLKNYVVLESMSNCLMVEQKWQLIALIISVMSYQMSQLV